MACSKEPVGGNAFMTWIFSITNSNMRRTWFRGQRYFDIEINTNNYCDEEATKELARSVHLASGNKKHRRDDLLVTAVDDFTIQPPNGQHICLVFEPMLDKLWLFKRQLSAGRITPSTLPLFKIYVRCMLHGPEYLDTDRHVVHTGIRLQRQFYNRALLIMAI